MNMVVAEHDRERTDLGVTTARVGLVGPASALAREVMRRSPAVQWHFVEPDAVTPDRWEELLRISPVTTLVYLPRLTHPPDLYPDLDHARAAFSAFRGAGTQHAVLVSSTAVYGATHDHPGLAAETRALAPRCHTVAAGWLDVEAAASASFEPHQLTVLRAAPAPSPLGRDYYSRLLASRFASSVLGHDPTVQFLSLRDLAEAIDRALNQRRSGIFNIVPAAPITLRAALCAAGARRIPMPWSAHLAARRVLPRRWSASLEQVRSIRYHLTASGEKSVRELGFVARDSSLAAILALRGVAAPSQEPRFDPFGLDADYIRACDRQVMGFLRRRYWRVDMAGLEHIPASGGAVLVGMHRGFMPFDGVMTLLGVLEGTGRIPRFLIHPGVGLRFPFLFNLMSKFGGIIACQQNADRVLAAGELLGVYPEGIRGAFTMYRRAHRIGPSWRNDCIAFALRHGVPLVPFVTVGSAEIFPILARVDSRWWKRYTEWPFIPITPTFPLVPIPLPSKWHTRVLEPIHVEREYSPEAAEDPRIVRAIGSDVKGRMEAAVADLVSRRRSIFFGSLREVGTT
jgi:1-acyl-sn-glycerol-3-phosphate acyltransferase/nucleoside-diphosphate-sugar epimerase